MTITIDTNRVQVVVSNHLLVIGKRLKDEKGSLWGTITAQAPEMVVVNDYIDSGVTKLLSTIMDVVETILYEEGVYTIKITDDRLGLGDKESCQGIFEKNIIRFVQSYAIAEFLLTVGADKIADKYEKEELSILKDIRDITMTKSTPKVSEKNYNLD